MTRVFFFVIFVSAVILFFGLAQLLLLRQLNRVWWKRRWIRRACWSLPIVGVGCFILFAVGEYYTIKWLSIAGAAVSALALILEISLMLSLPISGAIHGIGSLADRFSSRKSSSGQPEHKSRRLFLKTAAAAVPVATMATGLGGVGRAFAGANVYLRPFAYENLPQHLEGLRILHLSDLHLAHYVTLNDLECVLTEAEEFSPDVVLVTGDIADDLRQLKPAIDMMDQLRAPLGVYACLGNHEHFRGVSTVRRMFAKLSSPLLVDQGTALTVGGGSLNILGIDDPVSMHSVPPEYFSRSIEASLSTLSRETFSVLMSHRPDAFGYASDIGIGLTLSGHTHGGQVGFMGRSALEELYPGRYLWGHYSEGDSQLYTSSGMGHWFPFRLGCPPEAPVIELTRSSL